MKKIILVVLFLLPSFIYAEDIVAEEEKYYVTTTIITPIESSTGVTYISQTEEITKEEYDSFDPEQSNPRATVETNYKKLTTTISKVNNSMYKYKAKLTWKNMPKVRSYDLIGIGFYGSVTPSSSADFEEYYCTSGGSCNTLNGYYSYEGNNGVGAMFDLPSGSLSTLRITLSVNVVKKNSNSTIVSQRAAGDYAHATEYISYNHAKQYSVDQSGVDPVYSSSYDSIPAAVATWTGTW
jgi:hypothetical protein